MSRVEEERCHVHCIVDIEIMFRFQIDYITRDEIMIRVNERVSRK